MRSRIVLAALAIVVLAAAAFWFLRRPAPAPAPATAQAPAPGGASALGPFAAGEPHTQQQLLDDIVAHGITPERATWYFSLTVGALPGVDVPVEVQRDGHDFDGTYAIQELYWVWPYLTAEQRQAAATLIDRPTATGRSSRAQSMPSARLAGWSAGDGTAVLPAVFSMPGDDTQAYNYDQLAANANQILVDHLGGSGIKFKVDIEWGTPTGTEYAHTTSWWRATAVADSFDPKEAPGYEDYVPFFGEYKHFLDNGCHLTVWNQKFKAVDGIDAQAILVHEMYHCWENRLAGTYQTMASVKPWIAEGEPTWAMAAALAGVGGILDESWNGYVFGPTVQYDTRKYDGVGVFGHMSDLTNADDVWSKLLPVFAAGEDDRNASALVRLMQGHDHDFFTSWGSSYFLDKDHERWTMGGPGQPPEHGPPATPVTVNDGFNAGLTSAPPTTAELFSISGDADIVAVSLYGGYARLHDKEYGLETELTPEAPVVLCIKSGGCKCPDGSDGASLFTRRATAPVSIGLDGGNMTGQIGLLGKSLDEFCKKPDDPSKPPPPPGGGGGGGGGGTPDNTPDRPGPDGATYGDPHVQTFDGTYLEFQRVGEYTLARSTKDDFTVQVRQVPVGTGRWASVNQAVATKIGGQRATVTLEKGSDGPEDVLRLDGAVVSGNPPALTGGTITRALTAFGTNYTFEWPDGTVLHANQLGGYAINVRLEPSAARRGNLEGLLGNDDGKPENDETAVPALADRWLVKSAASLFDYAPGQSSATFIDPDFPDPNAVIPNRDAAERDCREEGLTDPQLLHNCVIDFAVTNGFLFRDQYAHQQAVLAARAAFGAVPASPAAADHRVVLMQGAVTDQTMTPAQSFTAQAGDILYVAQTPDCVDRDKESWHVPGLVLYFHLYDPAGREVGFGEPGCELGRRVLEASGTYTVKANVTKDETGPYHVPITFVRHDRVKTVAYGAIISGTIEQPGAHDLYTFDAKAGDLVQIAGKGCQLSGMFTGVVIPQGATLIGPGCNEGSVFKVDADGRYQLLVNNGNAGSGPYQFVLQGASSH